MKRYNLINNLLGWLCFLIAAVTYLLTIEPTASFWDCPEFILQGFKLEVGHPPGNPIFMLAARFFINFAGDDISNVAAAVNTMSALLSAGTILLLFWTVTHLVKRLIVKDDATEISLARMLVIFGSGLCGALAYTWSDTFWFSAVEGEVYAFSSFCTALVFWLILKWENRADLPHSDKYLVFIAYVIGISIAVHLLNLLCIPAIVLVVYYRKWKSTTAKGSLIALLISFVIVALILYGLVPGFIAMAQKFELLFTNSLGASFNTGTLVYAIVLVAMMIWTVAELYRAKSRVRVIISFALTCLLSGIFMLSGSLILSFILTAAVVAILLIVKKFPTRILALATLSIMVIFAGYSSYALLLIRSSASTPMNQNAPDNVFALASYLNREQYGERPLLYGQTVNSLPLRGYDGAPIIEEGAPLYAKTVKTSPSEPDSYTMTGHKKTYKMTPELNMIFPRIYSNGEGHPQAYADWSGFKGEPVAATVTIDDRGNPIEQRMLNKPTFAENLSYFINYQLNWMYWRYFMWNFAGRQNDIQGNGEVNHGNWISGIPFIDNMRLGDQSLLPYDEGEGNKGRNVFFMLPLILGIIGLGWQAFTSKRGIEQFWVVFFLFFMTGIAIVIYLNQTPGQPRERDYAFAGSFYAYAIWIGIGVAGLWRAFIALFAKKSKGSVKAAPTDISDNDHTWAAILACIIGLIVPIQMVSQTWDDHDRSGRYTARDFGMNYLNSLEENAIIFTNGDNDTFPLWYAQEVEGERTDVKVVNLSYLTTDWYVNQITRPSYEAPAIKIQAQPKDYAYDRMQYSYFISPDTTPVPVESSLAELFSPKSFNQMYGVPEMKYPKVYIPIDTAALIASGRITRNEASNAADALVTDLSSGGAASGATLSQVISLDMLNTSAKNGWDRPIYFAMTVPERYYLGLTPFMRSTGLAYQVTPFRNPNGRTGVDIDRMYRNVTERFRWGGLDQGKDLYLDETVRRMVSTNRSAMVDLATALYNRAVDTDTTSAAGVTDAAGNSINENGRISPAASREADFDRAVEVLDLMREKLPESAQPWGPQLGQELAELYVRIGIFGNRPDELEKGLDILKGQIASAAKAVVYYQSLTPAQYSTLQMLDRYIDRILFWDLIQAYIDYGGDPKELEEMIREIGVDLNRQAAFQQRQSK
ncbi:MAG: DUF2723 domain-containing protein [Pseudoflavonifractor sp.]|nr:DUF2723 domain-containing protein [Alloprevotella sp.]MCM1117138.1 DUF2723 domain-containing protein [Pseudoflavonifractor sp.]